MNLDVLKFPNRNSSLSLGSSNNCSFILLRCWFGTQNSVVFLYAMNIEVYRGARKPPARHIFVGLTKRFICANRCYATFTSILYMALWKSSTITIMRSSTSYSMWFLKGTKSLSTWFYNTANASQLRLRAQNLIILPAFPKVFKSVGI